MYRIVLLLMMSVLLASMAPTSAAAAPICFPGTPGISGCLEEPFAAYWQANGGLPVFGYPISPVEQRSVEGGATRSLQWTERNRLESHPENQPPYNVLLGRMGAERLAQLGRDPLAEGQEPGPRPGCRFFAETGHNVCDQAGGLGFKRYWESNGLRIAGLSDYDRSLALFGYPLTEARMEPSAEGGEILTQWFERARFEWHPDKPDQYKVLLGLLGREVRSVVGPGSAQPPAPPAAPAVLPSYLGTEVGQQAGPTVLSRVGEAAIGWVRYNSIRWSDVEPRAGQRNWAALATVEQDLQAIVAQGAAPMVIVRGSPAWARASQLNDCGPISEAALDDFARFMADLAARYAGPPYNVRYWELGNEPDAPSNLFSGESVFGCWGDESDPYYGGGYYAEMLKQVYPAIKQANPAAQVVIGGLLIDCDPSNPPTDKPCPAGKFFEGVLRNGGGQFFDIAAYHAYAYWELAKADFDLNDAKWKKRGGVLLGKLDLVRSTMRQYGIDKPVIANEVALLCYRFNPVCAPNGFADDRTNYALRIYARGLANGLAGISWYTLTGPGWQDGGLLDANQQPRTTYTALRSISALLAGASYSGPLASGSLEGYAFRKGERSYQIYWTNDLSTVDLPLPAGTRAVYNMLGEAIPLGPASISIGYEPRIIEITN
jgi:hypothetical protein